MGFDGIRSEIAHMRLQITRQQRDIRDLQRAGINTRSAEALLSRMQDKVDQLCLKRDELLWDDKQARPTYSSGKRIYGTPAARRG